MTVQAMGRLLGLKKTECLIKKISGLSSCHDAEKLRASIYTGKLAKAENNQIFLTIDVINQAINTGKKISFQHFFYTPLRRSTVLAGMDPNRFIWYSSL